MKNVIIVDTESDALVLQKPNVVLVKDTGKVIYNASIPYGVYIQDLNSKLYTTTHWAESGLLSGSANGVVVVTPKMSVVVATKRIYCTWFIEKDISLVEGVLATDNVDVAFGDLNGEENTRLIAEALGENSAAYKCSDYVFPNGVRGYLPSLGELAEIKPYLAEYNNAASLINATKLNTQFWSSTQYKSGNYKGAWGFSYFNNEDDFALGVASSGTAIPFGRLVNNTTYDEDNYIKFYVDKAEYYAPKGSIWSDWVNSTDSDGKIIKYKGDICLASSTGYKVTSIKNETSGQVKPNDEIVPDRVYSFVYVIDLEA
jgi:hypothetical protein